MCESNNGSISDSYTTHVVHKINRMFTIGLIWMAAEIGSLRKIMFFSFKTKLKTPLKSPLPITIFMFPKRYHILKACFITFSFDLGKIIYHTFCTIFQTIL